MFKEERTLLNIGLILLLALSTTLYFGQQETIHGILNLVGLNNMQTIKFVEDLFLVENALIPIRYNYLMGIVGYLLALILLVIGISLRKPKRKKSILLGITLLFLGFLEIIVLDISVIGWLAGPMIMISGFLIYKKSYSFM